MFIDLTWSGALQVVLLGFIGGVLSGFIGSGGAFFMTPGMMNLGVPGVVAVASNITHKFGKAMMGSKKHAEMGNVDKKLGVFLILTSFAGIRLAVWINTLLFEKGSGGKSAAADLYISLIFVFVLSLVAISMVRDALRASRDDTGPSKRISEALARLRLFPLVHFPVADVRVSLWVLLAVGLATGFMAGTIGVGGFIGVPAMIYVFGIPTAVAAGTELYLAMWMGAFGALNYAYQGYVDLRLTALLYLGSLFGIYIGAYGTKVVKEVVIRMTTGVIILLCVASRAIAIPSYLGQMGWIEVGEDLDGYLNDGSKVMLFAAGIVGCGIILYHVGRAYTRRRNLTATLRAVAAPRAAAAAKRA
jgi:hypothetical protein